MIPIFYRPEMVARTSSFSPSAGKPTPVVNDWLKRWPEYLTVQSFEPATPQELCLAHSPSYVADVLACRAPNGFGNTDASVARSLPYTTGSMLAAARYVTSEGLARYGKRDGRLAISPTSGFHHAHHDGGGGYCTFNGLAVAAIDLVRSGRAKSVAILDCDFHEGDGTQDILDQAKIGSALVLHLSAGAARLESSKDFFRWLRLSMLKVLEHDVVFYQAGADMCLLDPLGGLLTPREMYERDKLVFKYQAAYNFCLVWNLAGGYQRDERGSLEPVLALHRATMRACVTRGEEPWQP